jgi:imidazolonepropionase-like amidohydrolase
MASVLLRGGTVIDGTGGPARPRTSVLIDGDRIAALGDEAVARATRATTVLDVSGRTVLPGLIDVHVHSSFPSEMTAYLAKGVTSVRYAGIDLPAWHLLNRQVTAGDPPGPRLFNLGPMLDRPPVSWPEWSLPVTSAEEAVRTAERLLDEEATDGLIVTQQILPPDLEAVAAAAHRRNRPVVGQIWHMDAAEAATAGIDELDNTSRILASGTVAGDRLLAYRSVSERGDILTQLYNEVDWDATARLMDAMVRRGVAYGPTHVAMEQQAGIHADLVTADPLYTTVFGQAERDAYDAFVAHVSRGRTAEGREAWLRSFDARREWIRRFAARGGQLVVGTDIPFGGLVLVREIEILAEAGLTPLQAIAAATGDAARAMRIDSLGVIEAGRLADVLVVDGDPTADLAALRNVVHVFRNGERVAGGAAS